MFDNPLIFYGLIFASALLIFDTLLRSIGSMRRSKRQIRNRLEGLREKKGVDVAYGELLKRRGIGGRDGEQSVGSWINKYVAQTGKEISWPRRVLFVAAFCFVGYLITVVFIGGTPQTQPLIGIAIGLLITFLLVRYLRNKRIKTFTQQLSPAIDILVRSLHAGHPLTTSIALVAREMPDPIGSEFGILSDQMTFGAELEQAMMNMYDRVGAPELNMLTVSVSVQRGTGGNLAEILENLSQMIRDRLIIKAKIKAISAEGRITSWIMLAFPFFLFFMLKAMVPTYFDLVWESGWGTVVVVVCLSLIFLGMLVIRRLVNFDY